MSTGRFANHFYVHSVPQSSFGVLLRSLLHIRSQITDILRVKNVNIHHKERWGGQNLHPLASSIDPLEVGASLNLIGKLYECDTLYHNFLDQVIEIMPEKSVRLRATDTVDSNSIPTFWTSSRSSMTAKNCLSIRVIHNKAIPTQVIVSEANFAVAGSVDKDLGEWFEEFIKSWTFSYIRSKRYAQWAAKEHHSSSST